MPTETAPERQTKGPAAFGIGANALELCRTAPKIGIRWKRHPKWRFGAGYERIGFVGPAFIARQVAFGPLQQCVSRLKTKDCWRSSRSSSRLIETQVQ
jgi:hypothetical protein